MIKEDLDLSTIEHLDFPVPCTWGNPGWECGKPAKWTMLWHCKQHGKHVTFECQSHLEAALYRMQFRSMGCKRCARRPELVYLAHELIKK